MAGNRTNYRKGRYSRNLEGWNAQGFFSPTTPSDAATDATLAAFYRDAAEGEIAIYVADAVNTDALAAGETAIIAQKQDGEVKLSTEIKYGQFTASKTGYTAPVIQEAFIGYNGTSGTLATTIVGGLQEFVASARETTPANQPFPVTEGRFVLRSGTPTDYEIANAIVSDINSVDDFEGNADENFVVADIINDEAGSAVTVATTWNVLKGSDTVIVAGTDVTSDAVAGDYLQFDSSDYTSGESVFKVVSSSFSTDTTIVLDRPWPHSTEAIDDLEVTQMTAAVGDAAEIGIRFRGADELSVFEVSVSEDLADAPITNSTAWVMGSGAAWQVAAMEDECVVFQGQTTINEAFKIDYGEATLFVDDDSATQYALYFITTANSVESVAPPLADTKAYTNIVVAAVEGSTLETALDTVFAPTAN